MKILLPVSRETFIQELELFRRERPSLSHNVGDVPSNATYRLYVDGEIVSGYAVTDGGGLRCVFSTGKGQGKILVQQAVVKGAQYLDCFDGYLVDFYKSCGFVETNREPNRVAGEPDVVYMAIPVTRLSGLNVTHHHGGTDYE